MESINLYSWINVFIHEKDTGYPDFLSEAYKTRIDLNKWIF